MVTNLVILIDYIACLNSNLGDIMADDFKRSYNDKATAQDFYCSYLKSPSRYRGKDKKMLHQIGRSRLKQGLIKEIKIDDL